MLVIFDDSQDEERVSFMPSTTTAGTFAPDGVVDDARELSATPNLSIAGASGLQYADSFSYDLDNNRTGSVHVGPVGGANETITYRYNGDDELKSQSSSLTGTTTNTYDANGSLTTSTVGTGTSAVTTTYTYDVRNKMVGYSDGTTAASYVYDDDDNRVAETVTTSGTSTTTLYLTDTQNPTGYNQPIEQRAAATASPGMTYILGVRVLGQLSGGGNMSYLLVDGHGSTQGLTNSAAVITSDFRYNAFGNSVNFVSAVAATMFLFGGDGFLDCTTGLYMHGDGVRFTQSFDFTQRDNYLGDADRPSSLGKYDYSDNDPIAFNDPSGRFTLVDASGTVAVGSIVASAEATADAGAVAIGSEIAGEVLGEASALDAAQMLLAQSATAFLNNVSQAIVNIGTAYSVNQVFTSVNGTYALYNTPATNPYRKAKLPTRSGSYRFIPRITRIRSIRARDRVGRVFGTSLAIYGNRVRHIIFQATHLSGMFSIRTTHTRMSR